ncbi:hypothetical protein AB0N05_35460 [Nocardia sp. NPDC051030]|uniref:hypothetical protein n=1 Tax=Nocardia sp. NPDC051030 TaxID=3155162 RepID=UPI00341EDA38
MSDANRLAEEGVSPQEWQVLDTVSYASITVGEIDWAMAALLATDKPAARTLVGRLAQRGWLSVDAVDVVTLTGAGRQVHERVAQAAR